MSEKLDEGDIVGQTRYTIEEGTTLHHLYMKATVKGPELIQHVLRKIEKGTVKPVKNEVAKGSYFSYPTKEDRVEFMRKGKRFF